MSKITYEFSVTSPYVSLKEYSRLSGIPLGTCRAMVRRGEIIIRPKIREKDTVQVNLIAMLKDALRNS
ncbi:DNA-binding protein [Morganella morganii]|uniref:DNA-binding protein n=1 Tax=Morganella morganii TaxID=582 RepID=UPI0020239777|nr:DNA-binding protein [Morganella morganii]